MKILHTSDWHLGKKPSSGNRNYIEKRYNDYFISAEFIVDFAINQNVNFFLISGDIFDKGSLVPDVLYKAEKIFSKLKNNKIKTIVIEGNHDRLINYPESWIDYLEKKELLIKVDFIFNKDINNEKEFNIKSFIDDNIEIYGISYKSFELDEYIKLLIENIGEKKDKFRILMLHAGVNCSDFMPGCVEINSIKKLNKFFDYIASGHLHGFNAYPYGVSRELFGNNLLKTNSFLFIPGSPEYWDLFESQEKKIILFDTEVFKNENIIEIYDTKKRNIKRYKKKYKGEISEEDFINDLKNLNIENEEISILEIDIESNLFLSDEKIQQVFYSKGALNVIIKYNFKNKNINFDQETLNIFEVEKQIIESWNNYFSKISDDTVNLIKNLKDIINENEKKSSKEELNLLLYEVFNNFLEEIIKEKFNNKISDSNDN